jgi:peroxiredoxin/uncharacterized membrane protein YphA (DoxX/SURF4 family)
MGVALAATRLMLALVFATAGVAKLADRPGTRRALNEFGASASIAVPLALLLPVAELMVAAMLLVPGLDRWGAACALVLLVLFSAAIANSLVQGRTADCHCFGQLHSSPASWRTIARNTAFGLLASFVLVAGGRAQDVDAFIVGAAALLLAAMLGGAVWVSLRQLHRHGLVPARLDAVLTLAAWYAGVPGSRVGSAQRLGLPIGSRAPDFRLQRIDGGLVTLASLLAQGRPTMLVFSDPQCRPCVALLDAVARWQRDNREQLTIAVITRGSVEENRSKADQYRMDNILVQDDREVADAYAARSTPSAVLVTPEGEIGSALALGEQPIWSLVEAHHPMGF